MSFQQEWQQKKEERQRRQRDGDPTMTFHSMVKEQRALTEAEMKAKELHLKRQQERIAAEQRAQEEFQKTAVSTLKPERKEEIRKAREERERAEKEQEEERKARAEEETRKMREAIQRRRQEAKRKQALEQKDVAYSIPKYNIPESIAKAKEEKARSMAEMKAERERKIKERIPQVWISVSESEERLQQIAALLHARLMEVYGHIYDLQQRKERQEYDMNEINARMKDMSKRKTVKVSSIDHGHVSMLKERTFIVEDKMKKKQHVDTKASLHSTGSISDRMLQLQINLKKDVDNSEKNSKKEPIKRSYSTPEQLKEELEASKREVERFRQEREENRKRREEQLKKMEKSDEERRKKAEAERRREEAEQARLKEEKDAREKARKTMTSASSPLNIAKVVSEQKAKTREETIIERVPSVMIKSSMSDAELRNITNQLHNQLKSTFGDIFDLQEQEKKNEYYKNELNELVGPMKTNKSRAVVTTGIVKKMKDEGTWAVKKQNGAGKSLKPKEFGGTGISTDSSVRSKMAIFTEARCDPENKGLSPAKINIYK